MQIKIFTIPAFDSNNANEEMNKFLRSHQILEVRQEFVSTENSAFWSFCVTYIQGEFSTGFKAGKEKIDYRKILDKDVFDRFEKLRSFRKEIAKEDAVPAYAVFIDAELVEMAKLDEISEAKIKSIKGIGEKRIEKYGKILVNMFKEYEKNRKSDGENS